MISSRYRNLLLAVAGALLLWAAWPVSPLTLLIFIAWLPLLQIAEQSRSAGKFFGLTYLHMVLWNLLTTWWVAKASIIGGASAFFANSLLMCLPWMLYYWTKKHLSQPLALLSLAAYWLSFEYLHQHWDLSWPWLTLGNVFATHPNWVQWYEYTGSSGGSLWVLLSNLLVFYTLQTYGREGRSLRYFRAALSWIALLFLPILISYFVKSNLTLLHQKYNVVVVQPNVDPYAKIQGIDAGRQLQTLIRLSESQIDSQTALVVWPETAIPARLNEDWLQDEPFIQPVRYWLTWHPNLSLLTGIEGYRNFRVPHSRYATPYRDGSGYYESYNSAGLMDTSRTRIYHKSKLVPGVEVLPGFLAFMAPVFEKFGGTGGGYARDSVARNLTTLQGQFTITPAICYESIYGEYLSEFNRRGSNLICVITNDGWWGDTPGYRQHMNYARLRAIESRKWVARSANTGISCFIDPYGNIVQQLGWEQQGALKQKLAAYITDTFFTKYGDLTSRLFCLLAPLLLLWGVYKKIRERNNQAR
ncbi:apolipoprotein N-acyltransferase [Niabella terrae]